MRLAENHPAEPLSLYGVHKLTAEKYYNLYHNNYGIKTVIFRIANPYGEKQQMKHSKYSIPGWFLRMAMEGKTIKIFGSGEQLRDYIHISDLTLAFLLAGITEKTNGKIYNCGLGKSTSFKNMVETIVKTTENGKIEYVKWPSNYEKEETGNHRTDISKLKKDTGWVPHIKIEEGIERMYQYYKKNKDNYFYEKY